MTAASGREPLDRAELLRRARRIDFRFLLPAAEPSRVAHHGRDDPELAAALRSFSRSFTQLAGLDERESFDLVVMTDPGLDDLPAAARLLERGGGLYVELRCVRHPGAWLRSAGRLAAAYADRLESLGLEDVAAYWHYPNLSACEAIVPLAERAALRHALGRREGGTLTPFKVRLGRSLVDLGLFDRVVPFASVLGSAPGGPVG